MHFVQKREILREKQEETVQCQRKEKERNKKRVRIRNEQNDGKEGKEKEFNGPYEKGGNLFKINEMKEKKGKMFK